MVWAYLLFTALLLLSIHCLRLTHAAWRAKQPYKSYRWAALISFAACLFAAEYCWSLAMAIPLVLFAYGYVAFIYIVIFSAKTARQSNGH